MSPDSLGHGGVLGRLWSPSETGTGGPSATLGTVGFSHTGESDARSRDQEERR